MTVATSKIGSISLDTVRRIILGFVLLTIIYVSATQLRSFQLESSVPMRAGMGDATRQIIYLTMIFLVVIASKPFDRPLKMIAIPPAILLVLFWCALSVTWAIEPEISIRRLLFTVIMIWVVCRTVDEMEPERLLSSLRWSLLLLLIANWGAVLLFRDAVHLGNAGDDNTLVGSWRGIIPSKNIAGPACAITIFAYCFSGRKVPAWLRIVVVVAAAYFLYRTQSKNSLGFTAIALLGGYAFRFYNPRYRALLLSFVALAGAGFVLLASIYQDRVMAFLGSSEDAFSGRIQIWHVLVDYISDHPMKGAGFQSFWNIGPDSPIYSYARNWVAENVVVGHCGYLDVAAQIGIPGMLLTVMVLFIIPIFRLLTVQGISRETGAMAMAMLLFALGHNSNETSMLERDAFMDVMIIMGAAMAYKVKPQRQAVRYRPRFTVRLKAQMRPR